MPRLDVDPEQLRATGAAIGRAGTELTGLPGLAQGLSGGVSEPSSTAGALADLGAAWSSGAPALQGEVEALGASADAAAFLYADTDARSMGGGP